MESASTRISGITLTPSTLQSSTMTDTREKGITVSVEEVLPSPTSATAMLGRDRADSLGFSPIRHIATTYRIRSSRSRKYEYGKLPTDEEIEAGGGSRPSSSEDGSVEGEDTYFVDEDTLVSQDPNRHAPKRGRTRTWLACGMVCGLFILGALLVLNIVVLALRSMYAVKADPDDIFSAWGHPGSGTEDLAWYPTDFLRDVVPIPCHSHNDYWRKVPLFSALHAGCIGTEADVWLIKDELYVGHNRAALSVNRTFRSLYVDPLVRILERQNPSSEFYNASSEAPKGVFDMQPNQTLALLVDVKTAGDATFRKVLEQVEPLRARGWLSTFADGQVTYGPVTLVGSGNTPFDVVVENGTYRYAFFDAPLARLENSVYDMTNSYYASVSIGRGLGTVWFGALRRGQLQRMRYQLQQAHARGLKGRYWALPAWPIRLRNAVWAILVEEGVDLLNVDDITSATRRDWARARW